MSEAKPSYLGYVSELPLQDALWWFIENGSDDLPERSAIFFALRERIREQREDAIVARYRAEQIRDNFGSPAEFMELMEFEHAQNPQELEAFLRTTRADQGCKATFEDWVRATAANVEEISHWKAAEYLRLGGDLRDKDPAVDGQWKLPEQQNAAELRKQALALLEQATAIDSRRPYVIAHEHRFGTSTYLAWFKQQPSEAEAAASLDSEFEPDREETLTIEPITNLKDLVAAQ